MTALTVIGVGNRLRGDDAIGPLLIDELARQQLEDVELVDAGSDALGILEYLEDRRAVVVLDACHMGRSPGAVVSFNPDQARILLTADQLSLHGLGLAETLKLAESLELLPEHLKIIGIEPDSFQLNGELTKPVRQALNTAMDHVHEELRIARELCGSKC